MEYRKLGKTDLMISEIGFGAWGIGGGWGHQDDLEASRAIRRAFELGINFYDTALAYGDGHSEKLIGEVFKHEREKVVIASKIPPKTFRWPVTPHDSLQHTFPKEWIIRCTEKTLKNLGSDYLDLQQLHAWTDTFTQQLEWHEAFELLKQQGKIRAFGVSANDWDPYGAVNLVRTGLIDSVQVIYNIFEQRPAERLLPAAQQYHVGILARVPFEEGLLTGKFRPGHVFDRDDWRAKWMTEERLIEAGRRVDLLKEYLAPDRPTLAALALKFILSHPGVTATIPGMRNVKHVEENVVVSDKKLLDEHILSELHKNAFAHGWSYPWSEDQ